MSKRKRNQKGRPAEPVNMNVMPMTEMTGGMPTLLPPMQAANIFSDVFELDSEDVSDE